MELLHAQIHLLEINQITFLACTHFLSSDQNSGCVYWIEPIYTAGEVSLFSYYMTATKWLTLQPFLGHHQTHHKHCSHGMSQGSATLLALQSLLWHVVFSKYFYVFILGCRTIREVNSFNSLVFQICFQ
jgi:hypothetical protein